MDAAAHHPGDTVMRVKSLLCCCILISMAMASLSLQSFAADAPSDSSNGNVHVLTDQIYDATNDRAFTASTGPDATPNTGDDYANGFMYAWNIGSSARNGWGFIGSGNATPTVGFAGWAPPGYNVPPMDIPGTWRNRSDLGAPWLARNQGDFGSIWAEWIPGDYVVLCTEVLCTNSSDGQNYTAIYEGAMSTAGSDNIGVNVTLWKIPTPQFWSSGGLIGVANQSAPDQGIEHSWMDYGYGVWTSMSPITPANPGAFQANMTKNSNSTWQWLDPTWLPGKYYALRQRWCWNSSSTIGFFTYGYSQCTKNPIMPPPSYATGPVSNGTNNATPTITYTNNTAPAYVDIYYTSNGGTTWVLWGTDNPADGSWPAGSSLPDGTYYWNAKDPSEAVPSGAGDIEAGPYVIETVQPTVTYTNPFDGQDSVSTTQPYQIYFSEPMNKSAGVCTITYSPSPPTIGGTWAWSPDGRWYNYTGVTWNSLSYYWINLTGFKDLAGNSLAGDTSFIFATLYINPPDTAINTITPNPYTGTLPDEATLYATGTDNATGGKPIVGIAYRIDRNDDGDFMDVGEGWMNMTPLLGNGTSWAQYSTLIDLHNCSIATPNIEARAGAGSLIVKWDITPAFVTYTIIDTTTPTVSFVPPTPVNESSMSNGTRPIRITAEDFRDVWTSGYARITAYNQTHYNFFPENTTMNFIGWTNGSNVDTFEYNITGMQMGDNITYWVFVSDGTQVTVRWQYYFIPAGYWPCHADNLWVEKANPNIIIHWQNVTDPVSWHIYYSNDKLATFPGNWTMTSIGGTARTWTHVGACTDGLIWYYIVRAFTTMEDDNSTMGVKAQLGFTMNAAPNTNNMFFSLPYNCQYKKASDIVKDIEGGDGVNSPSTKISLVGQWSQAGQAGITYFYEPLFLDWEGTDFAIAPGDGLYFGIISTFNWVINGTDTSSLLTFTLNAAPTTNNMFFSLPYASTCTRASDIVKAIEGGDGVNSPSTKISLIGLWSHPGQSSTTYFYDPYFLDWEGTDFPIIPGDGLYLGIISNFTWIPSLITPRVTN
ncbi:MAG: Ig-like domain-containing protein [Euryarchaeota archaeon]|nr:Ig-like domain-containing protein [Euryarchaeota archaeon]